MTTIKFIFDNFWREGTIGTPSTEHAQYPAANTQDDIKTLAWRSRHGSASGNGQVVITAANKYLDFDEGGAELTATITEATYTAQTLVAEIKTRMDAAGGTYTPSYSESTGKYTIASASAFTLRLQSGAHAATGIGATLGFTVAANKTGEVTYTSENIAIGTGETVDADLGAALEYDFIALLNHNLTADAVITAKGADDAAFTTNVVSDTLPWNAGNIYNFLAAARAKQFCRIQAVDPKNPSCYLQIGTIVVGKAMTPDHNFSPGYSEGPTDETELAYAPSMNLFVTQRRPKLTKWILPFKSLSDASKTNIVDMMENNGISKALVFCKDTAAPNDNSAWAHFKGLEPPEQVYLNNWTWTAELEEVL